MKFLHLGLLIAAASSLMAMNNDPFRDGVPAFLFKSLHKPLGDESIKPASSLVAMNGENNYFNDGVPAFSNLALVPYKPLEDESTKPASSLMAMNGENNYFNDGVPAFSNLALVPYKPLEDESIKPKSIQYILENFRKALNETTEFKLNIPKFSLNIPEVKLNLPELQIIEPNSYGLMREHTLYSQALYKNSIGFEVIGNSGTYRFIANKETPKDELMKVFNEWLKSLCNIEPSNLRFIDFK